MRSLPARLRSWLGREPAAPYCVDFSDSTLVERLAASDYETSFSNARSRKDFRIRAEALFFADSGTLRATAERVAAERPKWRDRLLERVHSDCRVGLLTYGQRGSYLGKKFPWGLLANGPGEDMLYAVRPHRFAFAPRLALAILYGAPLEHTLAGALEGWMRVASAGRSKLPYLSNLVVIQRFIALSWAWAFLTARSGAKACDSNVAYMVLKILHADACFLMPRLGDSYPNNHLLLDVFAGWYMGLLFPEFIEEPGWLDRYEELWLHELARQTYEDGTSFEHSTHYHEYACEMTAAYVILCQRNGRPVPNWVTARLERMLAFQIDLTESKAVPLAIGNGTEDPLFPLDLGEGWGAASFRELYRALFDSNLSPSSTDDPAVERAFWLLGGKLTPLPAEHTRTQSFKPYPVGGFFVFSESNAGTRLIFRTGPMLDRPLMGGHMHADLLGIYAYVDGNPIVIDAGTYTYRAQLNRWPPGTPRWRTYFAGPEAHNGLSIRDIDPLGPLERDFRGQELEVRVPTTRLVASAFGAWVESEIESQNAYGGYRRGVIHVSGAYWLIYDQLPEGISAEAATFGLQFVPGARVKMRSARGLRATVDGALLEIAFSEGLRIPQVLNGSLEPLGGWVSRRYGELEPAPQIRTSCDGSRRLTAFLLEPGGGAAVESLSIQVAQCRGDGLAFRITCGERVDYLLLGPKDVLSGVEAWGIRFEGAWLWLRTIAGVPMMLRWLEGQSVQCEAMDLSLQAPERTQALELQPLGTALETRYGSSEGLSICWPTDACRSRR